jgi:hypothetical protein
MSLVVTTVALVKKAVVQKDQLTGVVATVKMVLIVANNK